MKNETIKLETPILVRIDESVIAGLTGQIGFAIAKVNNNEQGWRYLVKMPSGEEFYPSVHLCTEMVCITKEEHEEFLEDALWLSALEGAGVDNWEGYDFAKDSLNEMKQEQNG